MKVSELSRAADVPLSTIKYYIREDLLPAGAATGRNQADYGEEHLKRLRLIRSLRDEAGLSLATITQVLRAADGAKGEPVVAAIDALDSARAAVEPAPQAVKGAAAILLEVGAELGWQLEANDASLASAARALATLMPAFPKEDKTTLATYFQAAMDIALLELPDDWEASGSAEDALSYALLGTILFEPLILSVRRMAHVTRLREIRAGHTARGARKEASPASTATAPRATRAKKSTAKQKGSGSASKKAAPRRPR